MPDPLIIAGREFGSRLFLGTAGYPNRVLMLFCGGRVHHLRGWGGVTRHAVSTLRGCATSVGMLLRPGGHDVLAPRRGVWVPHGDSAGGVFHEEPVVAPMSPSMRSASLNASRIISRCSRCSLVGGTGCLGRPRGRPPIRAGLT